MPAPEHYSHAIQLRFGVYRPFDIILVHSFSRFARDNLAYAIAKQTLKKAGIGIQSISQPLNDDPTGELVESIITAVDAHHSRETPNTPAGP